MSILITGANGFVGREAIRHFLDHTDHAITGLDIAHPSPVRNERVRLLEADLLSYEVVRDIIREVRPKKVLHLAALSSVSFSLKMPAKVLDANYRMGLNLLEALRTESPHAKILMVSTSEVYGAPVPGREKRTEDEPLRPESPYAASKASLEFAARQYSAHFGLKIVTARPFNHSGPGQPDTFVLPGMARKLMEIKHLGREPVIYTGNIDIVRDFLDVSDVTRAYGLLLDKGRNGEAYNICSGTALPLRWMLDEMVRLSGLSIEIRTDLNLVRKYDIPILSGSHDKLTAETGWQPEKPFADTLRAIVGHWEECVRSGAKPA